MKIKVKIGKKREEKHGLKRGIRHISIVLPNCLLKSRLAFRIIRSGIERNEKQEKSPVISADFVTRDFLKKIYGCLKTVIRQQGHFNLVDVESADGTKVIIRF